MPRATPALGRVFLYYPEMPALCCTLLGLDTGGCCARVPLQQIDAEIALAWQYVLLPGQNLRLRFDFARGLADFDVIATLSSCSSAGRSYEIQFSFDSLDAWRSKQLIKLAFGEPAPPALPTPPDPGPADEDIQVATPLTDDELAAEEARTPIHSELGLETIDARVDRAFLNLSDISNASMPAVSMPHPAPKSHSPEPSSNPRAPGVPPLSPCDSLDATLAMERPDTARRPGSGTELETVRFQPERRASGRADGQLIVEVPRKPDSNLRRLGQILVESGKLSEEQLHEALAVAQASGQRLGSILLDAGMITPDALCRAMSQQSGLPMTLLESDSIPEKLRGTFPLAMMMHDHFVPFDESLAVLCIAASSPLDPNVVHELERISKKVVEVFMARDDQVARQLDWMRVKMKTRSRRYLRFEFHHPASYQFCTRAGVRTDREVYEGWTVNISEGGCLIDGPQPAGADPADLLRKGFFLNASIKTTAGTVWSIGEVREIRLSSSDSGPRWLMGVEYVDLTPENRHLLREVCHSATSSRRVRPASTAAPSEPK